MTPHSSTLAWKIPWTEKPGRLQSMGSRRVGHDWATSLSLFTFTHWRRKWQPTPVFLPGESQRRGSLVGWRLWGQQSRTRLKRLGSSSSSSSNWLLSARHSSLTFLGVRLICIIAERCSGSKTLKGGGDPEGGTRQHPDQSSVLPISKSSKLSLAAPCILSTDLWGGSSKQYFAKERTMVRMVKPHVTIRMNLQENIIKIETPGLHPHWRLNSHLEICMVKYSLRLW